MTESNERIEREQEFHDLRYTDDSERKQKVGKFYSITSSIYQAYEQKLFDSSKSSKVIEYGCGTGSYAFKLAQSQAELVTGIDISPIAIETARQQAAEETQNLDFQVMNAENLQFEPDSYDLICGSGILHHLDLGSATESIKRVLKPSGKAVFVEPLGHNFAIELYRRLTPNIRSQDEHPLLETDLQAIKSNFKKSRIRYFYLTSLISTLIAGKPGFKTLLYCCELLDSVLLKLPGIRQQAWMVLIELEQPINDQKQSI